MRDRPLQSALLYWERRRLLCTLLGGTAIALGLQRFWPAHFSASDPDLWPGILRVVLVANLLYSFVYLLELFVSRTRYGSALPLTRRILSITLFVATVLIGLLVAALLGPPRPLLTARIQAAGGFAALRRDAQLYYECSLATDTCPLPQTIANLHPVRVGASDNCGTPFVDIQVLGGFAHHGLLVFLDEAPLHPTPPTPGWRHISLGNAVLEYRE